MKYIERQIFRQEPDIYSGVTCNKQRPRWMTSYPKEGDEEVGATLQIEIDANSVPPGSRVIIEVPVCPNCGDPADMREPKRKSNKWLNCDCGFSWSKWVEEQYA